MCDLNQTVRDCTSQHAAMTCVARYTCAVEKPVSCKLLMLEKEPYPFVWALRFLTTAEQAVRVIILNNLPSNLPPALL